MSNEEIIARAIHKAISSGWEDSEMEVLYYTNQSDELLNPQQLYRLIFNHDFAKSLWGYGDESKLHEPAWQYHLQQMVIADDPIQYLGKHLTA